MKLIRNNQPLIFVILLVVFANTILPAQDSIFVSANKAPTSPPDGIYENPVSFIKQLPELKTSDLQMGSAKTIRTWIKRDSLYFTNENGAKTLLSISQIWGFYEDQTLYFQINGYAHKVIDLGELSYFNESYPVMKAPYSPVSIEQTKEVFPKIYDFKTNKVVNYSVANFSAILKERDKELYDRFQALENNKKRRQVLLKYLGIYNDRHPLAHNSAL